MEETNKTKQFKNIFFTLVVLALAVFGLVFSAGSASATTISSFYTSQIKDLGSKTISWSGVNLEWSAAIPTNTSITAKVRSCNDAVCSGETDFSAITQTVSLTAGTDVVSGSDIATLFPDSVIAGDRYFQYQATLSTTDVTASPSLDDITVNYNYYSTSQTLTSSAYNTGDSGVLLNQIDWEETGTSGSTFDIKFQIRTAPDNGSNTAPGTWGAWCGPTSCAGTPGDENYADSWHDTPPTDQTANIQSSQRDSTDDQWIQYKVWFVSDGSATPTLTSVTMQYVSNSSPCLGTNPASCAATADTITASQNSNGTISVSAIHITDSEESVVSTPSQPKDEDGQVSLQYFYDVGVTLTSNPLTSGATTLTLSDSSTVLPSTGTIMIDNDLSANERPEVINYNSKSGTTSATLSGLIRGTWPNLATTLSASIADGSTIADISLVSASALPSSGKVQIGSEVITYTSKVGDSLSGITRGANGASHSSGAEVWYFPTENTTTAYTTQTTSHTSGSKVLLLASSATTRGAQTGISSSNAATYTATLTPVSDLNSTGIFLQNTAKIRAVLNDGNIANQVGSRDSTTMTVLDTLAPAASGQAVFITSTASSNNLTISITELSTWYMRFANVPNNDGTACSTLLYDQPDSGSTAYQASGTSYTLVLSPHGTTGVSTVCYEFKDAYNNKLQGSATTPATPGKTTADIHLTDISYVPTTKWRQLIWWTALNGGETYKLYRDSGAGYVLLGTITDPNNYCFDEGDGNCTNEENGGLDNATTYTYRVTAQNTQGISSYSATVSGIPNGTTVGEVDTTDPVITAGPAATVADTTASITFTATDANSMFYSVIYAPTSGNNVDPGTYTKQAANPSMMSSGQSGTVEIAGLGSGTWHAYKILARDIYGNPQSTPQAGPYYFQTSIDSTAPSAIDDLAAPAASIAATSVLLTWTAQGDNEDIGTASSYDVRYSTVSVADISTNWATATQVSNEPLPLATGSSQSMTVTGLTPESTYYFAIKSSDEIPNPSAISNVVTVTTPSQTDTTIPVITNIVIGTPAATSVTITWDTTNKASSSLIDFGETTSYGKTQGDSSALDTTGHSVTLVGLTPETIYKFQVKSVSAAGVTGTNNNGDIGFTTDTAPVGGTLPSITSVASSKTATTAIITWTTTGVSSDSVVGYSVDPDKTYSFEAGNTTSTESHSVTLTGLSPGTKYYYRVKSRNGDQQAIAASDSNGDFNFTTDPGSDTVAPTISNLQVPTVTANSATITWDTLDENSNSYVDFGIADGVYTSVQGKPNDSTTAHSVILISLTPETSYYFRVRSADAAGNSASLVGTSFTTTSGAAVDCPVRGSASCQTCETCPASDLTAPNITNIKIEKISFNVATVTWTTDEASSSIVQYDTVSFGVSKSYAYSTGQLDDTITSHSVTLANLDSATTYYFRVSSADAKGNVAKSDMQSFKTIAIVEATDKDSEAVTEDLKKEFENIAKTLVNEKLVTEENIKEIIARISNPPIIGSEGPIVKNIKSYGATVVWQTDRKANSVVKFKPAASSIAAVASGESWHENSKADIFDTVHEVSLLGLSPSTSYSFYVQSQDILGGITKSPTKTFITEAASSIFNVAVADLGLNRATVNWETANYSTSSLEWGLSSIYGNYLDRAEQKDKKHSINISNLSSGTLYHFRVRSVEDSGNILTSDDYAFTTYELPQITKYTLGEVKDTSIALQWISNIPIDSNVRYTDTATNQTEMQGKEDRVTDHKLILENLDAGKSYKIEIQGRDEKGNMAEIPAFEVQTGIDNVPPELSQVRSQAAILGGAEDKVQAIISWRTDELSDTKVLWDLGSTKGDKFSNETKVDPNLTTNHIAVITQFKPGTVYRFRVVSTDKFGNIATSSDYTILTPVRRQSVIQMIVNQFESIFGWMKILGRQGKQKINIYEKTGFHETRFLW